MADDRSKDNNDKHPKDTPIHPISDLQASPKFTVPKSITALVNKVPTKFSSLPEAIGQKQNLPKPILFDVQLDKSIQQTIDSCLNAILLQINDDINHQYFDNLAITIRILSKSSIHSLYDYIIWHENFLKIVEYLKYLYMQIFIACEQNVSSIKLAMGSLLIELTCQLFYLEYQLKIDFVKFALFSGSNVSSIFFDDVTLTERQIRLHVENLIVLFHPKDSDPKEEEVLKQLCQALVGERNSRIKMLQNQAKSRSPSIDELETRGTEEWEIAVNCQRMRDSQLTDLCQYQLANSMSSRNSNLEIRQYFHALSSYDFYRVATREMKLDDWNTDKQVKLHKLMALALNLASSSLKFEAQLYVIISIYLLSKDKNQYNAATNIEELEILLHKLCATDIPSIIDSSSNMKSDYNTSRHFIQAAIDYSNGSIKEQSFRNLLLSQVRSTISDSSEALFASVKRLKSESDMTCASDSMCVGISFLVAELFLQYGSQESDSCKVKGPAIRRNICRILADALYHYRQRQFGDFFATLSTPYNEQKVLLRINEGSTDTTCTLTLDIRPETIVRELLSYNFSSECIANILVLIGEVLLCKPLLTPSKPLARNIQLKLPSHRDLIDTALKCFHEVSMNLQLRERLNQARIKIGSALIDRVQTQAESGEKKFSSYKYTLSSDYIRNKLTVSVRGYFDEIKLLATVNISIAKLMIGGTQNLEQSYNMISQIKQGFETRGKKDRLASLIDIRLQVLSDIFHAFGFVEDVALSATQQLFSEKMKISSLDVHVLMSRIDHVCIDERTIVHCQPIIFFEDEVIDEFSTLDEILENTLKLSRSVFVNRVCSSFEKNVEPITTWMKAILKEERFGTVEEWKTKYLEQKHVLTFRYLPFLSFLYNLTFRSCVIRAHPIHRHVFALTGEVLDFSKSARKVPIYVITLDEAVEKHARVVNGMFVVSDDALNYLHNQLDLTEDSKVKAKILSQIGLYHQRQAAKFSSVNHFEALKQWNTSKESYEQALKLNGEDVEAIVGTARSLIMLNRYELAEKVLDDHANEVFGCPISESWFLKGLLKRKLQRYDEAKEALINALKHDKHNVEAKKELTLVEKLRRETMTERIQVYKKASLAHVEPNSENYNILSIDGGGIRGLIPSIWLSELERRTCMSSSSMFHMMAGTSTGAVVAAGLSLPEQLGVRRPRYKAVDLVELYSSTAKRVFQSETSWAKHLGCASSYTDAGRKGVFEEYFHDIRLSDSITDLLVTAVRSGAPTTDIFTRHKALADPTKNYKIVDVLMCSSAAPTYFPAYRLNDQVFVDGGVQANNPTMLAYGDACSRHIDPKRIFILSLGTGDYIPDPLHPDKDRHLLFWMFNIGNVLEAVMTAPQNNTDHELSTILGIDKYHRWQLELAKLISLDETKSEILDGIKELARAHFEEMENLDSNKRLGQLIERLTFHQ